MAHFAMRGRVVVDEQAAVRRMARDAADVRADVAAQAKGDAAAGQALFAACSSLSRRAGRGQRSSNAPKLAGQGEWYLARQLQTSSRACAAAHEQGYVRQADGAVRRDARRRSGGAQRRRLHRIAAGSAPGSRRVRRRSRSEARSSMRPALRATAPTARASGRRNAPRLSNMSDWYMARQLQNFRSGIRGTSSAGFPRRADGVDGQGAGRRSGDRRPARLHPHAVIDSRLDSSSEIDGSRS